MTPPNIVLIHGHDLGRWLSCYGRPSVPSPHLDSFAQESIVFDRAFATAPLCTPARSSMFTGLSPHVNGLVGLAHAGWRYRDGVRTLPEMLSEAGYDTALIGLQHEHPDPLVLGFEHVGGLGFLPHAAVVVDEAIEWLKADHSDAPFFLTVGMWEAHRPWGSQDYASIDPESVEVPGYLPDNEHTRRDLAEFYGAISYLDEHVGRLLDALSVPEIAQDTLVIFTTDHGAALPGAKSTLYDPGVEVALVIRPPTEWHCVPGRIDRQVSHLDLVPTLLEIAESEVSIAFEGESLAPALLGTQTGSSDDSSAECDERSLYFGKTHHDGYDPMRAVRTQRWKYIRNFEAGPRLRLPRDLEDSLTRAGMGDAHLAPRMAEEFYDLVNDPHERTNLAGDPRFSAIVSAQADSLATWMRSTRDPLLAGPIPPPPHPTRNS